MNLREELSADLQKAVALYGQTFNWDGDDYACVRKPAPAGLEYEIGGVVVKVSERITVARALFVAGEPQIGDGIDSDTIQIKDIDPNAENLILIIGSFDEG